jgi:hypothetical protein
MKLKRKEKILILKAKHSLWGRKILPTKTEVLNGSLRKRYGIFRKYLITKCRGSRSGSDAFMAPGSGKEKKSRFRMNIPNIIV